MTPYGTWINAPTPRQQGGCAGKRSRADTFGPIAACVSQAVPEVVAAAVQARQRERRDHLEDAQRQAIRAEVRAAAAPGRRRVRDRAAIIAPKVVANAMMMFDGLTRSGVDPGVAVHRVLACIGEVVAGIGGSGDLLAVIRTTLESRAALAQAGRAVVRVQTLEPAVEEHRGATSQRPGAYELPNVEEAEGRDTANVVVQPKKRGTGKAREVGGAEIERRSRLVDKAKAGYRRAELRHLSDERIARQATWGSRYNIQDYKRGYRLSPDTVRKIEDALVVLENGEPKTDNSPNSSHISHKSGG